MKLSELQKLLQDRATLGVGESDQIRALNAFLENKKQESSEAIRFALQGNIESEATETKQLKDLKTIAEDPDIKLAEYLTFASIFLKIPKDQVLSQHYLNSFFVGAEVFKDWIAKDNEQKQFAPAIKIQETHFTKLNKWLQDEIVAHHQDVATEFKQEFTEKTELPILVNKLKESKSETEINYLTLLIGYKKAEKLTTDYETMQAKHPGCHIEIIELKRHDESTNPHKGFGLNLDTPLTALHKPFLGKQKRSDLDMSKNINGACVNALGAAGVIASTQIDVKSSPLSRAVETDLYSTLPEENISKITLSKEFAETKKGNIIRRALTQSSAARNSKRGVSHTKEIFKKAGVSEDKLVIPADAFDPNESEKKKQDERVEKAVHSLIPGLFPVKQKADTASKKTPTATFSMLVAHGGVIRAMLRSLKNLSTIRGRPYFKCDIPPGIIPEKNLGYGEYYTLLVARDANGKVIDISYNGKYSRLGVERPSQLMTGKEFRRQTEAGTFDFRSKEIKEIEVMLNALSLFANNKTEKKWSLFHIKKGPHIHTKDQYDSAVNELLEKVNGMLETDERNHSLGKRKQGLEHLKEQLQSIATNQPKVAPTLATSEVETKRMQHGQNR